jgi:Fic family protein
MALAQDEKLKVRFYSVSSQIMRTREDYYNIIENVQNCRIDTTMWLIWFLECVTAAIEHSQDIIAHVFRKAEFWKKHSQTQLNDRQRKVIAKLMGARDKEFVGGLTTRKYVGMTKISRATAFREINDLVTKGVIRHLSGKGRSVSYEIVW